MQNKFNNLTKEFESLKRKINQCPPISQISSKDLLHYHSLISKKELLESQISKLIYAKENILKTYSNHNEQWLYDDNMNCRKYCKLEKRAAYVRDKKLFKLGFIDSKPTLPFIQDLKQFISGKILQPISEELSPKTLSIKNKLNSFIKKTPIFKLNNFIKSTLPIKLTNVAIHGTKRCIIGYRRLSTSLNNSAKSFSRNISSVPVIQILSYINTQAKKEADLQSTPFLSRIKVDISSTTPTHSYSHPKNQSEQDYYDIAL